MSLEIAAKLMPRVGQDTTSDICAIDRRPDGSIMVVLADVIGQPVPGRVRKLRERIQTAASCARAPGALLEALNADLAGRAVSATAVAVLAGPCGGNVHWASASHPPPRRLDTGEPLPGTPTATPLGQHHTLRVPTERAPTGVRCCGLLLHTDGVVNATGPRGVRFGEQRLTHALRALPRQRAGRTLDDMMRTVCHFAAHALPDDTAAVVIRRVQASRSPVAHVVVTGPQA
jgi:hypothetical protein